MTTDAQPPRIRTLLVTGLTDIHHDWRSTTPALQQLLERTGRFDVRVTEEFRGATAQTLEPYELVVLNYYGRFDPWGDATEERWGQATEQALFDFVRGGKGLVGYHPSLSAGVGWGGGEYERMLGGVMRADISRRAPINDFRVRVAAPEHPITAGWPGEFPHYDDDIYVNLFWPDDVDRTVLLTGWDDPLKYTQAPPQWRSLPGRGEDHPVAWTARYGEGRTFSTGLGHGVKAIGHPGFRSLFPRGAEWAATGAVTIPVADGLGEPIEGGDWWPTVLEPLVRKQYEEWLRQEAEA